MEGLSRQKNRLIAWCFSPKSVDRLARVQASGHLEEQTPRTLLKNIILTGEQALACSKSQAPAPWYPSFRVACPVSFMLSLLFLYFWLQ